MRVEGLVQEHFVCSAILCGAIFWELFSAELSILSGFPSRCLAAGLTSSVTSGCNLHNLSTVEPVPATPTGYSQQTQNPCMQFVQRRTTSSTLVQHCTNDFKTFRVY